MPSTYTVNLGIEKPATGEQSGTWGDTTNINFDILDQAINGCLSLTLASAGTSGSPNTLAISDGATSDGRNKWIEFVDGGDLGATAYVQLTPNDAEKIVFIRNSLSGSRSVILFQGTYDAGRDLEVPAGVDMVVKFSGGGATATTTDIFTKLRATEITTPTLTTDDLTAGTADINDGTVEAVIGGTTPKAGTFTNLTANTNLSLATGATVTGINTTTNMSDASATTLATSLSIKTYVDDQVATVDTLAEVLANGNTSGENNLIIDSGQALTANTINETTAGSGVTIDSVLLKDDGVNATNLEITNIKANDGTAAGSIANSTGAVTITSFISNSVDIGGGAIDDTNIGASSAGSGAFTTLSATGDLTVDTDTLYVDSTNDRVGINVASPDYALDVLGTIAQQEGSVRNTIVSNGTGFEFTANANSLNVGRSFTFSSSASGSSVQEHMRIDSVGRVLINGTASTQIRTRQAVLQSNGTSSDAGASFTRWTNGGGGPYLTFAHSRSATVNGGFTILQADDILGSIDFAGADGTDLTTPGASIDAVVDGTPGANDMPGRLQFYTTADGAASTTERMRITNGGFVGIGGARDADTPLHVYSASTGSIIPMLKLQANVASSDSSEGASIDFVTSGDNSAIGSRIIGTRAATGANMDLRFHTARDSFAMLIDTSQRVLIGTSSSINGYHVQVAENSGYAGVSALRYTNDAFGAYLNLGKSRTTTIGGNTIVQDNDVVGYITFSPNDGTDLVSISSQIQGEIDGTPGSNDTPGRLVFSTTADGAASPTERMRITNEGNIGIGGVDPVNSTNYRTIDVRSTNGGQIILGRGSNQDFFIYSASAGNTIGSGASSGYLRFMTNSTGSSNEAMRIDSSQRVLIGTDSVRSIVSNSGLSLFQIESSSAGKPASQITMNSNSSAGPVAFFAKTRGTTNGSNTVVQGNDYYGSIQFAGADGTDTNTQAAMIAANVDGAAGANDMPGRLSFWTTADGASSGTERMRIDSAGTSNFYYPVKVTTSTGIGLGAATPAQFGSGVPTIVFQGTSDNGRGGAINFREYAASGDGAITGQIYSTDGNDNYGGLVFNAQQGLLKLNTGGLTNTALAIDQSQRVLIGHTSSIPSGGDEQQFQVTGVGSSDGISLNRFNTNYGAYFTFGRAGDANIGTYVAVPTNDDIGRIQFAVADGTDMSSIGAMILSTTEAEAASNDTPANLRFLTTSDGNQSPTERMRIDSAGRVMIAGAAGNVNAPTSLMGDMNAAFRVGTSSAQIGSLFKYTYGPNTKVDGAVFQLRAGSNGNAAYIRITVSNYQGVFEAHYYCNNASGNWTVNQATVTDVGGATAPSLTVAGSGGTSPTITVDLNSTSYSGGFLDVTTSSNWQLTLA